MAGGTPGDANAPGSSAGALFGGDRKSDRPAATDGVVAEVLANDRYLVKVATGNVVTHVPGASGMAMAALRPGDRVRVEVSPLDPGMGRIVGRVRTER